MEKPTLIYIFDPLCGWCFGFHPVIKALHSDYRDEFLFDVRVGGLILGDRVGTYAETYPKVEEASDRVEQLTGQKFGKAYREKVLAHPDKMIMNSEPACKAFVLAREEFPEKQVEMSASIQDLLFVDGENIMNPSVLQTWAESFGVTPETFESKFNSEELRLKTYEEFASVQRMQATGFPAVIQLYGTQGYLVARGYRSLSEMHLVLEQVRMQENK